MKYNIGIDSITSSFLEAGLSQMAISYPRDFEIYMCAIELADFEGNTIDYFSFPVMPSNISKSESEATTIQHSFSGTTVINKDGFTPNDISISGNFGRTFKVAFEDRSSANFKAFSIASGAYSFSDLHDEVRNKVKELPFGVKTGFGCIKILQSIVDKAKGYDDKGRNFRLYFYNAPLGESYLVVPTKTPLEFVQNENNSNMMWNYTLNLTIIADLKDVVFSTNKKSLESELKPNFIKSSSNLVVNNLLKYGL